MFSICWMKEPLLLMDNPLFCGTMWSITVYHVKKSPAMSVDEFYNCLAQLARQQCKAFTYLKRSGAIDLSETLLLCPQNVIFLKMRAILTPRYRKMLLPHADLNLNYVVESNMLNRILQHPNLRFLSQQREVQRQRNLDNRVRQRYYMMNCMV